MNENRFRPSISIIRVIAMLSIVFAHICAWQGIYLYQMGGIGVEIFLFISGYLYGKKQIPDKKHWIVGRVNRVMRPFWLLTLVLSIWWILAGSVGDGLAQIGEALLDLQGTGYLILHAIPVGRRHLPGISHCWFLTMIMICYGITLWIKGSRVEGWIDRYPVYALLVAVAAQVLLAYLGVQVSYILQYFIGYFYCRIRKQGQHQNRTIFWWSTAIMMLTCGIRLMARSALDGTVLYDHVLARLSFNALAVWLYLVMSGVCGCAPELASRLAQSRFWRGLDALSYPIFLVHYMFMKEPFALEKYISMPAGQVCAALALTGLCAWLLLKLDKVVDGWQPWRKNLRCCSPEGKEK